MQEGSVSECDVSVKKKDKKRKKKFFPSSKKSGSESHHDYLEIDGEDPEK